MSEKRMQIMRDASYLLPPPGGEVVRELLDRHASLLARHNALREAVEWERKAHSAYNDACVEDGYGQLVWATENLTKARAEVDRLLMEEK